MQVLKLGMRIQEETKVLECNVYGVEIVWSTIIMIWLISLVFSCEFKDCWLNHKSNIQVKKFSVS